MSGALVASMGLDISEFTRSIDRAMSTLNEMSSQASEQMKRIETSITPATVAIEKQDRSWVQFAGGGVKSARQSLQDMGDAARSTGKSLVWAGFASTMLARLGVLGGKTGLAARVLGMAMTSTGKEVKSAGWYAQVLGKNYEDTAKTTKTIADAHEKVTASTKPLSQSLLSLTGNLSTTALVGAVVWKAGLDEIVEASGKWLKSDSDLMTSVSGIASTISSTVQNGFNMFAEGIEGSVNALLKFTTGFDSITEMVDAGGSILTDWAKYAQSAMKDFGKSVQEAGLVFGAAIAIFQSGGNFDAGAYIEEGRKLNELAEQTARTLEKQNTLKGTLSMINDAAGKAASESRTKNELARIATLQSVEAIDAEIQAMKVAAVTTDQATQKNKSWIKEQEAKAAALGKRKQDLVSGGTTTGSADTAKEIEKAQKKLDELTMSQEAVAVATAKANGATQEQIDKLLGLQSSIEAATSAQEAENKIEEANDKAADQLAALRRQYDELTGAVTKADAARQKLVDDGASNGMANQIADLTAEIEAEKEKQKEAEKTANLRKKFSEQIADMENQVEEAYGNKTKGEVAKEKALRDGATEEEAAKIGELTDAEESAKEKDKKGGKSGSSDNQAVLAGTAEANKIISGGSSKLESLAEKQIKATTDVVKAIQNKDEVEFSVLEGV